MDTLYLKIDQNVEVHKQDVTLDDIGKMFCSDQKIVNRLRTIKLVHVQHPTFAKYTVSVLVIIKKIQEVYPELEINNIGESEFVLTYKKIKEKKLLNFLKVALVCAISLMGSAFAIMTFNNDVGVLDLFGDLYEKITGREKQGITVLEISYSLGLAFGIVTFFNHFFGRKITVDPTPLEVEMCLYEDNVNTLMLEKNTRKEYEIDVD